MMSSLHNNVMRFETILQNGGQLFVFVFIIVVFVYFLFVYSKVVVHLVWQDWWVVQGSFPLPLCLWQTTQDKLKKYLGLDAL